jgi:formylglycine-generating enzyme required for sulfatase activity
MLSPAPSDEQHILSALLANPDDLVGWQALADVRLERGDRRGELLSLHLRVWAEWDAPQREAWRGRMMELLLAEVPFSLPAFCNSLGMEFALIPPGRFLMGSPPNEEERQKNEQQHEVEITQAFGLGVVPVTVGQFRPFVQATGYRTEAEREEAEYHWQDPGFRQDDHHPVVWVSWNDAQQFCAWLTRAEPGRLYRLPTEAEWEYACRAGASESHPFHVGKPLRSLSSTQANFNGNYPYGGAAKGPYLKRTTPVRSYKPNAWGLYDMHGNVWEWCSDWYDADYYRQNPRQDPPGPSEGSYRVFRGSCWNNDGQNCRSAYRSWGDPSDRVSTLGFRVALVLSGGS